MAPAFANLITDIKKQSILQLSDSHLDKRVLVYYAFRYRGSGGSEQKMEKAGT
jgi:hypothetical protein